MNPSNIITQFCKWSTHHKISTDGFTIPVTSPDKSVVNFSKSWVILWSASIFFLAMWKTYKDMQVTWIWNQGPAICLKSLKAKWIDSIIHNITTKNKTLYFCLWNLNLDMFSNYRQGVFWYVESVRFLGIGPWEQQIPVLRTIDPRNNFITR